MEQRADKRHKKLPHEKRADKRYKKLTYMELKKTDTVTQGTLNTKHHQQRLEQEDDHWSSNNELNSYFSFDLSATTPHCL